MRPEILAAYPPRPASEFEWEDLLVRVELMLRALRVTIDDVHGAQGVLHILDELAIREAEAGSLLESAALRHTAIRHSGESRKPGERGDGRAGALGPGVRREDGDVADLLAAFLRRRQRNFAILQRRGLEVWNWTAKLPTDETVTVYQLLSHLVTEDVRALAAIRAVGPEMERAC